MMMTVYFDGRDQPPARATLDGSISADGALDLSRGGTSEPVTLFSVEFTGKVDAGGRTITGELTATEIGGNGCRNGFDVTLTNL